MIARLGLGAQSGFAALLAQDPVIGGQIATALDCCGEKGERCGFYRIDTSAALLVQGGGALLCGRLTAPQREELAAFLRFAGVRGVTGRIPALPGWRGQPITEMLLMPGGSPPVPPLPEGVRLCTDPPLWPLREGGLLPDTVDPDGWYAGACARRARGLAEIWTLEQAGRTVAAAGLYSLRGAPFGGYLSGVFTLPEERGRGYASVLTAALAAGRRVPVRLLCDPALEGFYRRLGFAAAGRAFMLAPADPAEE